MLDTIKTRLELKNPALLREQSYINGQWVSAEDEATFAVTNPADGSLVANVPELDERITDEARNAPRPVIEPLEPVIATVADADLTAASEAALIARAARLQARADEIRRGQ